MLMALARPLGLCLSAEKQVEVATCDGFLPDLRLVDSSPSEPN